MKRWGWAFAAIVLACLPILFTRASGEGLLHDTDTRVLIARMEQRAAPLSWFTGDWPLENHFYRPVTTLTFELDQKLHPWSAAGYGLTNALLAIGCVLMLFWFLRELTEKPVLAVGAAGLFAVWNAFPNALGFVSPLLLGVAVVGFFVSLTGNRNPWIGLAGIFVSMFAAQEVVGLLQIRGGSLDWIPGRTATTMTLFALAAMAMYARYERLTTERMVRPPSPLDQPATKGTEARTTPSKAAWLWVVGGSLCCWAALGAYEQAVMLPACLAGVAVAFRLRGYRSHTWPHVAFWAVLGVYLVVRKAVIPPGNSEYQLQQYRSSVDVLLTLCDYAFSPARSILMMQGQLEFGWANLLMTQWQSVLGVVSSLVALTFVWGKRASVLMQRDWTPLIGYALSFLAFLPMAWFKAFPSYNHYHYWPMALRALFAVSMLGLAIQLIVTGASRRAIQAPLRRTPAPGSLPHR